MVRYHHAMFQNNFLHRHLLPAALVVAAFGASALPAQPTGAPPDLHAFTDVLLIDGTGEGPRPGMTVLVEGSSIRAVFPSGDEPLPEGTVVHELSGRTIVPGLIDAHIHMNQLGPNREERFAELRRMLHGGVVAARDMGSDLRIVGDASRSTLLFETEGPDIYYSALVAGPGFIFHHPRGGRSSAGLPPGSTGWSQAITEETDLRLAVARAAGTGATGLKVYASLAPGLVEGIAREAHRQGLRVWAHAAVFPGRPLEYVRAGVDGTSHLCGLPWQDADADPSPYETIGADSRPRFEPGTIEPDGAEITELLDEMARRGTLFDPTLAVQTRGGRYCPPDLMVALARAAIRHGVTLVAGTDFVAEKGDPYPALHQELTALVELAGLSPLQALETATRNAAAVLGLEETHGTIEPGKLAHLVVLQRSPERDIGALREVVLVAKRGRIHERR